MAEVAAPTTRAAAEITVAGGAEAHAEAGVKAHEEAGVKAVCGGEGGGPGGVAATVVGEPVPLGRAATRA
ncbi:hypothetical protein [Streptomyces sp. NPDC088196]|uniref:hypothetical protein n=1 Tax=Streptomyces sp. NPDC088196 TaxID=3154868 RepID=UPI00344E382F